MHKDLKPLALMLGLAVLVLLTSLAQPQLRVLATDALGVFSAAGSWDNTSSTYASKGSLNDCDIEALNQSQQGGSGVNFAAYGAGGCANTPSTSTNHESGGMFGAVSNSSTTTNAVGGSFYGIAGADGSSGDTTAHRVRVWGVNPLVADGGKNHVFMTNELDYNIQGPDTLVLGLQWTGVASHDMAAGSFASMIGPLSGHKWPYGHICAEGGTVVCIQVGTSGSGNNVPSQIVRMFSRDSGGNLHYDDLVLDVNGNLVISPLGGNPVWINKNGTIMAKGFVTY